MRGGFFQVLGEGRLRIFWKWFSTVHQISHKIKKTRNQIKPENLETLSELKMHIKSHTFFNLNFFEIWPTESLRFPNLTLQKKWLWKFLILIIRFFWGKTDQVSATSFMLSSVVKFGQILPTGSTHYGFFLLISIEICQKI